jgi:hypothetical protein
MLTRVHCKEVDRDHCSTVSTQELASSGGRASRTARAPVREESCAPSSAKQRPRLVSTCRRSAGSPTADSPVRDRRRVPERQVGLTVVLDDARTSNAWRRVSDASRGARPASRCRTATSHAARVDLAICFAGLGDKASALAHLGRAFNERVMRVIAIGDPEFDELRSDSRFRRLVEQLRLPA